jgi:flagellar hook-length control protein FliK
MSTTPTSGTSSSPSANGPGSAAKSGSASASRSGQTAQSPADLFASLLGLLSATHDMPQNTDGGGLAAQDSTIIEDSSDPDTHPDGSGNPLAALLSWPGAPAFLPDAAPIGKGGAGTDPAGVVPGTPQSANPQGLSTKSDVLDNNSPGQGTVELNGMTVLEQPESLDPDTLAAMSSNGQRPAAGYSTRPDTSAMGARSASWRSTTALAQQAAGTHATTAPVTTQIQLGQAAQVRGSMDFGSPASRSTLALDNRFSVIAANDDLAPQGAIGPHGQAHAQGGSEQPATGGGTFTDALDQERTESHTEESDFTLAPETPAEELLPEEAALSPHALRHASLRVGENGEDAIDIQLALRGEQLNVDFRTDNAEARASLQSQASETLSDMLERGGIQLGQVSVGAQSQQSNRQGDAEARHAVSAAARRNSTPATAGASDEGLRTATAPRRSDGSRPLDLFV